MSKKTLINITATKIDGTALASSKVLNIDATRVFDCVAVGDNSKLLVTGENTSGSWTVQEIFANESKAAITTAGKLVALTVTKIDGQAVSKATSIHPSHIASVITDGGSGSIVMVRKNFPSGPLSYVKYHCTEDDAALLTTINTIDNYVAPE